MGISGRGWIFGPFPTLAALRDQVSHRLELAEAQQAVLSLEHPLDYADWGSPWCLVVSVSTVMSRFRSPDSLIACPTMSAPSWTTSSATP